MIPQRGPGQSFEAHQADVACWLGCDVATMNRQHDDCHRSLCLWLGIPSHAMREAKGQVLTPSEQQSAAIEEAATLHVQKLICHHGIEVPRLRLSADSATEKAG